MRLYCYIDLNPVCVGMVGEPGVGFSGCAMPDPVCVYPACLPMYEQGKRIVYYDIQAKEVQFRMRATGVITFSFYRLVKGGEPERVSVGRFSEMAIEQAHKQAAQLNAAVENRESPVPKFREARQEMTLEDLFWYSAKVIFWDRSSR